MQTSPSRRRSSRWSAVTRSTNPTDRVPADPEQAADRRAGHLLRQPRDDVLEVARVMRARTRPRDRLHPHPAGAAAQQPQLALDHAAIGAEIQVPPALETPVVDLEPTAGLTTRRADAAAAPQPHDHDHRVGGEADVDDGCPGHTEQPLECGGDAHVALLEEQLTSTASSLPPRAAARRSPLAQPPRSSSAGEGAANARRTRSFR